MHWQQPQLKKILRKTANKRDWKNTYNLEVKGGNVPVHPHVFSDLKCRSLCS